MRYDLIFVNSRNELMFNSYNNEKEFKYNLNLVREKQFRYIAFYNNKIEYEEVIRFIQK